MHIFCIFGLNTPESFQILEAKQRRSWIVPEWETSLVNQVAMVVLPTDVEKTCYDTPHARHLARPPLHKRLILNGTILVKSR